jgi:hypothetical protein
MKRNDFKKLIKETADEHDGSKIAEVFEAGGEKELADFVRLAADAKKRIEPDRSLMLRILNEIPESPETVSGETVSVPMTRVGLQLHMGRIMKFAIPAALAILIGIFIWQNPFGQEKSQVAELKDITKEEKAADQSTDYLKKYLSDERKAAQVSQSSESQTGNLSVAPPQTAPFDAATITAESNAFSFDPSLADFLAQEKSMSVIDATLANF